MSRLIRRFGAALVAAAMIGVAGAAGPASAAAPEKEKGEFEAEFTVPEGCGDGADLRLVVERVSEEITFTDGDGATTRQVRSFRSETTWTRLDTGNTIVDRNRVTRVDSFVDGELVRSVFTGPQILITAPGEGLVAKAVGRIVVENGETVFEAGPNDIDPNFFETVCGVLA